MRMGEITMPEKDRDESGELTIMNHQSAGRVVLVHRLPTVWFSMTPKQARALANKLRRHADTVSMIGVKRDNENIDLEDRGTEVDASGQS